MTCVFDGKETEGLVIRTDEVLCVSPEYIKTGRLSFELYIVGEHSSFSGISTFISGETLII